MLNPLLNPLLKPSDQLPHPLPDQMSNQPFATPLTPAPSPCINVCVMDSASGWCTGCFRTIDEIVSWANASNPSKWAVLHTLEARENHYFQKNHETP